MDNDQHIDTSSHSGAMPIACSMLRMKCPRCRKGSLFVSKNPFVFKHTFKMPERCTVCGQDFLIEPGFYIGALWISFPIVVLAIGVLSALLLIIFKMQIELFFVVLTAVLLALQPLIIRLGRSVWIHIFVRFQQQQRDTNTLP